MKSILLLLLGALFMTFSGCKIFTKNPESTEPKPVSDQPEIITEDIEVIAASDTTGQVSAAKEAAMKLIADAKREATRIKRQADAIMTEKSREAEKKASEIVASVNEQIKKNKSEAAKQYLLAKKAEAQDKTEEIINSAKSKASDLKNSAMGYANKLKEKSKKQSEKISKQIIENARKSAADMTAKANIEADKIKKEASKLFESAKTYTDKKKEEADAYVKKKMDDADKAVTKIQDKIKKDNQKGDKPVLANSILDKILEGMKDGDYNDFTGRFTNDLKSNFTKERFQALNKQLKGKIGAYKTRTYLGSLQKGPLRVYLWKASFTNAKNNDLVIRLTLGELDEKEQVFAFDISNL